MLKRTIIVLVIALAACFFPHAASAEDAGRVFRIGLIGWEPGQSLQNFDPLVKYLRNALRRSGVRNVTVFVAQDLNELRSHIKKERLDFILTSAFPLLNMEMECEGLIPSVVAVQGTAREESAVFFVRKESPVQHLGDLRGKTLAFGTPWSTAGYALAMTALTKDKLAIAKTMDNNAPADSVRYLFAGEPINQAFRVLRGQADAGVFGNSDWGLLPPNEQAELRIIHRTEPVTRLLGTFHPAFPPSLRSAVEQALFDMAGNRAGQAALEAANMTAFDRLTDEDRSTLQRLERRLWYED